MPEQVSVQDGRSGAKTDSRTSRKGKSGCENMPQDWGWQAALASRSARREERV